MLSERLSDLFLLQGLFEIDTSGDCPSGWKSGSWGRHPQLNKQCQFLSSGEHWHGAPASPASSL